MNNAFIFDLDGVLVDSKEIHFDALNLALSEIDKKYVISKEEQELVYEGLSTKAKLNLLSYHKGLPVSLHDAVWQKKQVHSSRMFAIFKQDKELILIFSLLKAFDIKIGVASNAIRETVEKSLKSLGVDNFVDCFLSNEDVANPKPNPEIYLLAMSMLDSNPTNSVIFEDSNIGRLAAKESGANLFEINKRSDVNLYNIIKAMKVLDKVSLPNIVIPMAGNGSRFSEAGYEDPKPLIKINNTPMIQHVVENIKIPGNYIFIVQEKHYDLYNLEQKLNSIVPNPKIIKLKEITDGAARTVLAAKDFINNEAPLIIANSDQLVEWDSDIFLANLLVKNVDGSIALFKSNEEKWSYAKIENEKISEVAEKVVISDNASVGIYGWKKGSDYVTYAEQMIEKNIRAKNEFYICPVYNEAIADNKNIQPFFVEAMHGLGTPEDLERYIKNNHV